MVTEFEDIICLSIDAESEAGAVIAKKYMVGGFPTLLFLNSDASPRDSIVGYMPTDDFHAELKRIKSGEGTTAELYKAIESTPADLAARLELAAKLKGFNDAAGVAEQLEAVLAHMQRGEGYDATSIDSCWAICQGMRALGENEHADAQLEVIKQLDPEGKSFPMRRMALDAAMSKLQRSNHTELRTFLADESDPQLLFEGWNNMIAYSAWRAKRAQDEEETATFSQLSREAAKHVWTHAPDANRAQLGNQIAWSFYESASELTDAEKTFALEVATQATKLAGEDVNVIDTYACCLFINGKKREAIAQVRRCLELDPGNEEWIGRLEQFLDDGGLDGEGLAD